MRIHVQRVYRTNRKTNIGNDSVFDGLVDNDAHVWNYELRITSYKLRMYHFFLCELRVFFVPEVSGLWLRN